MRRHGDPAQRLAMGGDEFRIRRLGDRRDRSAVLGEILHLGSGRSRVGGDRNGAEFRAGIPGEDRLRAVVKMDEDEVASPDAARRKACGEPADALVEGAVGERLAGALERRPEEERMVAPRARPRLDEPRHIDAAERAHIGRVGSRHSKIPVRRRYLTPTRFDYSLLSGPSSRSPGRRLSGI